MWRESVDDWGQEVDYAISFQDSSGCDTVWCARALSRLADCPFSLLVCFLREFISGVRRLLFEELPESQGHLSASFDPASGVDGGGLHADAADRAGFAASEAAVSRLSRSHMSAGGALPEVCAHRLPDIVDRFASASTSVQQKRIIAQYVINTVSMCFVAICPAMCVISYPIFPSIPPSFPFVLLFCSARRVR
jgi:hypothetical protein